MQRERLTLTVEEAADVLGISRSLAYELVRRGAIPSLHLGRRIVVPIRGLEALVEECAAPQAPDRFAGGGESSCDTKMAGSLIGFVNDVGSREIRP